MIQPLVENSVGHGMRSDGGTLTVTISAHMHDHELCISVADDGEGIAADRLPTRARAGRRQGARNRAAQRPRPAQRVTSAPRACCRSRARRAQGTTVRLTIRPLPVAEVCRQRPTAGWQAVRARTAAGTEVKAQLSACVVAAQGVRSLYSPLRFSPGCRTGRRSAQWRADREAEGARLEIVCAALNRTQGSNPWLSASQ